MILTAFPIVKLRRKFHFVTTALQPSTTLEPSSTPSCDVETSSWTQIRAIVSELSSFYFFDGWLIESEQLSQAQQGDRDKK